MTTQPTGGAYLPATARALSPLLRGELRGWAALSIAALAVAGLLAPLLALSRTPKVQAYLPWQDQEFFYRALITHVVFSIVVWYLGAFGTLAVLGTARAGRNGGMRAVFLGPVGLGLGTLGCVFLLLPVLFSWGPPFLNNYVPVVGHPMFHVGLMALAAGVALVAVRFLLNLPGGRVEPVDWGIAATAVAYLVALVCFVLAWFLIPSDTGEALFYERLFWGGGHVLQFVNTAVMLTGWYLLCEISLGEPPLRPALFLAVMGSLAVLVLPAPVFYFVFDVLGREHREAFTQLLWYHLTLPPAVMTVGIAALLFRHRGSLPWSSEAFHGLILSVGLFTLGGLFGFFLGVADTRTPSHYHAVIAGVNLSTMALYLALLPPLLGRSPGRGRLVRWQFYLYGCGQILFSVPNALRMSKLASPTSNNLREDNCWLLGKNPSKPLN
ncbi:MAG: cbb3-type cytochrome c oxidase subunit I [Alphaproteobacteria bacterium]